MHAYVHAISYFADSMHARIGAARRVALGYAPPRQEEKQFFSTKLQREYDEAWREYVSLNNLHNARDIGGGREARKPSRDLYRRLSRRDVVSCEVRGTREFLFVPAATKFCNVTRHAADRPTAIDHDRVVLSHLRKKHEYTRICVRN